MFYFCKKSKYSGIFLKKKIMKKYYFEKSLLDFFIPEFLY